MKQNVTEKKKQERSPKHTSSTLQNRPKASKYKYTIRQKLEVLKILQRNKFNYTQTAHETQVNASTIKRWRNEHPEAFCNDNIQVKQLSQSIEIDLLQRERKFFERNFQKWEQICEKLSDQMLSVLEAETDVEKIAKTLKIIREIMIPANVTESPNTSSQTQINILQLELEKLSQLPCEEK